MIIERKCSREVGPIVAISKFEKFQYAATFTTTTTPTTTGIASDQSGSWAPNLHGKGKYIVSNVIVN